MLVLKRALDQKIVIGGGITVTVCEIGEKFVRLGVDAPREITVDRNEVHARKLAEAGTKQEATEGPATDGPSL